MVRKGQGRYCSRKCKGIAETTSIIKKCPICKEDFRAFKCHIKKGFGKYCSNKCYGLYIKHKKTMSGKNNYFWNGGKHTKQYGYIAIYSPDHPFKTKDNYVLEHRLVAEKYLGRFLTEEEVVHHKGIKYPIGSIENKQDNRIENLELFPTASKHLAFHNTLRALERKIKQSG